MSVRQERVAELIQQEIGSILSRGLKDPRIGFVTVTGAKVSPDLREAWVYYAVHGDERARQDTAVGLAAASGFLRRALGQAMHMKSLPTLHFVFDEAIERGDRIEQLIKQVHDEEKERAREPGNEGQGGQHN